MFRYKRRHVALKIAYLGWDYDGFACQETTMKTIEEELFKALNKAKLIESRQTSNYHRCGRTDKGVSAFGQVVSIDLRSSECSDTSQNDTDSLEADTNNELKYPQILNRILPKEIRVIAWAPVHSDFSARFDCKQRTYRYFFPKGGLDLDAMQKAGEYLVGTFDFRNFCKIDPRAGYKDLVRKIMDVSVSQIKTLNSSSENSCGYEPCELVVVGQSFLWHQIRYIVSALFHVGTGLEPPETIKAMLDVSAHPARPQYSMASDFPLLLYDCEFDKMEWICDQDELTKVTKTLQEMWTQLSVNVCNGGTFILEVFETKWQKLEKEHNSGSEKHFNKRE